MSATRNVAENLQHLIALIEKTPEQVVYLESYVVDVGPCGTMHCTLGHACLSPYFNAQGLSLIEAAPYFDSTILPKPSPGGRYDVLFGKNAFHNLFSCYASGNLDQRLLEGHLGRSLTSSEMLIFEDGGIVADISHKQLALLRLKDQLKCVEAGTA
jgi:hypothetical protein